MTLVLRADSIGKAFAHRSVLTAATLRAHAGEISFWSSQDLVEILSRWLVRPLELVGADPAKMTVAPR